MLKRIYICYVFLIPFQLLFNIKLWFGTSIPFSHISTFVMLVGLFLSVFRLNVSIKGSIKWIVLWLFLALYNVIMAILTYKSHGVLYGETTLDCIVRSIVLDFLFVSSICYNFFGLKYLISSTQLKKILLLQSKILLFVGYWQLGIIYGVPGISIVNDFLGKIFCLSSSEYLTELNRGITLFGSEPASIGLPCIVFIPFVFIYSINRKKYLLPCLWLLLFLLSGSSQALLMFMVVLMGVLFVKMKKGVPKWLGIITFVLGGFFALTYTYAGTMLNTLNIASSKSSDYSYMFLGKLIDTSNYSTVARMSTIINDMKIFAEHPITGVGDGIQGYYYNENMPRWVLNSGSQEVRMFYDGTVGILSGGGNFFPRFISAYGLIGILVLLIFLNKYRKDIRRIRDNDIHSTFAIGICVLLLAAWITVDILNCEYVAFLLSLPYLKNKFQTIN